jgi:hypothetical protein
MTSVAILPTGPYCAPAPRLPAQSGRKRDRTRSFSGSAPSRVQRTTSAHTPPGNPSEKWHSPIGRKLAPLLHVPVLDPPPHTHGSPARARSGKHAASATTGRTPAIPGQTAASHCCRPPANQPQIRPRSSGLLHSPPNDNATTPATAWLASGKQNVRAPSRGDNRTARPPTSHPLRKRGQSRRPDWPTIRPECSADPHWRPASDAASPDTSANSKARTILPTPPAATRPPAISTSFASFKHAALY